jgi:hypothetical protein
MLAPMFLPLIQGEETLASLTILVHFMRIDPCYDAEHLAPEFLWYFEAVNFLTLTNMLIENLFNIFGLHFLIPNPFWINDNNRTDSTRPQTSGAGHCCFSKQTFLFDSHRQFLKNCIGTALTTRPAWVPRWTTVCTN